MGGTANVARIFGSVSGDYGVQPDGGTHDWREDAACADRDVDVFYKRLTTSETERLRDLCNACPVLDQCRAAMRNEERVELDVWGFRAGLTQDERRDELTGRRAQTKASAPVVGPRDDEYLALFEAGLTIPEVAESLNTTRHRVVQVRHRLGIKGGQGGHRRARVERDEAIRALHAEGRTDGEIADALHVSRPTVHHARKRLELAPVAGHRGRGGARGRPQIERQR